LPEKNSFTLSEIKKQAGGKPLEDITVRGAGAPPIEIDFGLYQMTSLSGGVP
jgi:hypothetical protein